MTEVEVENIEDISCFAHVPKPLETWFIVHFIIDYLVAIPLFIAPRYFLEMLGWESVDPLTARVVAAALFAIGGISFLSRNEQVDTYKSLVVMKIVWSVVAEIGILISIIVDPSAYSFAGWIFLGIFLVFTGIWIYWWNILKNYTS